MKKSLGEYSYNDLRNELQSYIQQKFGTKSQSGDYWNDYPYIVDVYENEFVVEKDGKYYIASYKIEKEGGVSVGEFHNAKKIYRQNGKEPVQTIGTKKSKPDSAVKISV